MARLSDLDYGPGQESERLVTLRFGSPVSLPPASSKLGFFLVASFGRSALHLNEDSISLILQACLGGVAKDFQVVHLSGWMFCFSISCKSIGITIYNLKSFM